MMKTKTLFPFLVLLGLTLQTWQITAGQNPQASPKPNPRFSEAEAKLGEAMKLFSEHTAESMEKGLEVAERARKIFNEIGDKQEDRHALC